MQDRDSRQDYKNHQNALVDCIMDYEFGNIDTEFFLRKVGYHMLLRKEEKRIKKLLNNP